MGNDISTTEGKQDLSQSKSTAQKVIGCNNVLNEEKNSLPKDPWEESNAQDHSQQKHNYDPKKNKVHEPKEAVGKEKSISSITSSTKSISHKFKNEELRDILKYKKEKMDPIDEAVVIVPELDPYSLRPKRDKYKFHSTGAEIANTNFLQKDSLHLYSESIAEEAKRNPQNYFHKNKPNARKSLQFNCLSELKPPKIEPPLLLHYKPSLWKENFSRNIPYSRKSGDPQLSNTPYSSFGQSSPTRKPKESLTHFRSNSEDYITQKNHESFSGAHKYEHSDYLDYSNSVKSKSGAASSFSPSPTSKSTSAQYSVFPSGSNKLSSAAMQMISRKYPPY